MRNLLQEQLLKAGLAKKQQVDAAARAQARQRDGKAPVADKIDTDKLLAERAERDRALAAERNARAREQELRAQIKQIIETHQQKPAGEQPYRFIDAGKIKEILVGERQRQQLANGSLSIARHLDTYALLPQAAALMVRERGGEIVVDHSRATPAAQADADEEHYRRFVVPDDLMW